MTHKTSLSINLPEPVLFLKNKDATGHRTDQNTPPAILRGLLSLQLEKATRISSIEVELHGRTVTCWPEHIAARRVELIQEHDLLSISTTIFRAKGAHIHHDDRPSHVSAPPHVGGGRHGYHGPTSSYLAEPSQPISESRQATRIVADSFVPQDPSTSASVDDSQIPPYVSVPPSPTLTELSAPAGATVSSPSEVARSRAGTSLHSNDDSVPDTNSVQRQFSSSAASSESLPRGQHPHSPSDSPRDARALSPSSRSESHATYFHLPGVSKILSGVMKEHVHVNLPRRGKSIDHGQARGRQFDKSRDQQNSQGTHMPCADGECEEGESWKEFKAGTYTYPIAIAVPANSPPSLKCEYGEVTWTLQATVHRPGAFRHKLTATNEVILVSSPDDDDTEESSVIIVERQWEEQMQYVINISGRSFLIGGPMVVDLTIMPLSKVKIYGITIALEETVAYHTQMRAVEYTDVQRTVLASIQSKTDNGPPLLPLPFDTDLQSSALYPYFRGSDPTELAGPGPWAFHHELRIPATCDNIRFTNRNVWSNITVTHALAVIFRAERDHETNVDPKSGRTMRYDIITHTPVHILSCRCIPQRLLLPEYHLRSDDDSTPARDISMRHLCPCELERRADAGGPDTSSEPLSSNIHLETTSTDSSMAPSLGQQYERLVSGQESTIGEAPPAYEE